jgi:hypothetical protein
VDVITSLCPNVERLEATLTYFQAFCFKEAPPSKSYQIDVDPGVFSEVRVSTSIQPRLEDI